MNQVTSEGPSPSQGAGIPLSDAMQNFLGGKSLAQAYTKGKPTETWTPEQITESTKRTQAIQTGADIANRHLPLDRSFLRVSPNPKEEMTRQAFLDGYTITQAMIDLGHRQEPQDPAERQKIVDAANILRGYYDFVGRNTETTQTSSTPTTPLDKK